MKRVRQIARILAWLVLPALTLLMLLAAEAGGIVLATATLTSFSFTASVAWNYQSAVTGLTNSTGNQNGFTFSASTTNGTGAAGTADLIYTAQITLAASGNTTVDLVGGQTDFFGTTISMARLKILYIHNTNITTATSITVGNATQPVNLFSAATTTVSIRNNGIYLYGDTGATGIAMVAATSDGIKIVNADSGNSATVNFCAVGSSA